MSTLSSFEVHDVSDDSSVSTESGEEENNDRIADNANAESDSDKSEGEVLEVFKAGSSLRGIPSAKIRNTTKKILNTKEEISKGAPHPSENPPPLSLIEIMAKSVFEVEAQILNRDIEDSKILTQPKTPTLAPKTNEHDIFGIAYKPFKKSTSTNKSSGITFEDEVDFEKEISANSRCIKNLTKENEFTIDDEFDFSEAMTSDDELSLALERAALKALNEDSNMQTEVIPIAIEINLDLVETEKPLNLQDASKLAFQELVSVYSAGLGDIEVRLLDSSINGNRNNIAASTTLTHANVASEVIEEGDEEAELEEEIREMEMTEHLIHAEYELQNEWSSLQDKYSEITNAANIDIHIMAEGNDDYQGQIEDHNIPYALISYSEALEYLKSLDLACYRSRIIVQEESRGSSWSLLGGGPMALKFPNSKEELEFPFSIAQVDYDPSIPQHISMLQSIYKILVCSNENSNFESSHENSFHCPVIGVHWDNIGFQGIDPRTDVNRSMKTFAILQALHLVDQDLTFARKLHDLSVLTPSEKTNGKDLSWPFMCVSIMFTKEAIQALRSGVLNKKCNKRKDVLSVLHDFHHACFFDFCRLLLSNPSLHHAEHLAVVRKSSGSNPLALLKAYTSWMKDKKDINTDAAKAANHLHKSKDNAKEKDTEVFGRLERFDDLDAIQQKLDGVSDQSDTSNSSSGNFWTAVVGLGSKKDKFQY